jgi:hypothetical protein
MRRILIGIGVVALLAALIVVTRRLDPGCGSVVEPGPATILGADPELFGKVGCAKVRSDAIRMSAILGVAGVAALLAGFKSGAHERSLSSPATDV